MLIDKDIESHFKEIETLKQGILNNLNTTTTANLSHRICCPKYLVSEIEWSIYVNHLFGGGCLSCQRDHMYAEKPWAEEMAKSMGRETWKHMVAKLEEKMESENQEDGE